MADIKMTDEINIAIKGLKELKEDMDKATKLFDTTMTEFNNGNTGYMGSASGNIEIVHESGKVQLEKLSGYYELLATFATEAMVSLIDIDTEIGQHIYTNLMNGSYELYIPKGEDA